MWQCVFITLPLGKWNQKCQKFKVSLVHNMLVASLYYMKPCLTEGKGEKAKVQNENNLSINPSEINQS